MPLMTDGILTDAQIAALSPEQRRDLISRLEQPLSDVVDPEFLARIRRIRLSLMMGGLVAMVPWIGYLAVTLPDNITMSPTTGLSPGLDSTSC
jgi:hypothetical protein